MASKKKKQNREQPETFTIEAQKESANPKRA